LCRELKKTKPIPPYKVTKQDLKDLQIKAKDLKVKTINLLDEIIEKNQKIKDHLDEDIKEQKLILQNLTKACESRNKAVHKIVNKSFKNAKTDTQKKVIPFKSLDKILEGKPPQHR